MNRRDAAGATIQRYLDKEGLPLEVDGLWVDGRQRLSSLCYLQTPESLLLLRRRKEPFTGFWTAPGGKIRPGETPREAAAREIREETDLDIQGPQLRLIASELGPDAYCWLLFGFAVYRWQGTMGETDEGDLEWVAREHLAEVSVPSVDRVLLPYVLEPPRGQVYVARVQYEDDGSLGDWDVREVSRS